MPVEVEMGAPRAWRWLSEAGSVAGAIEHPADAIPINAMSIAGAIGMARRVVGFLVLTRAFLCEPPGAGRNGGQRPPFRITSVLRASRAWTARVATGWLGSTGGPGGLAYALTAGIRSVPHMPHPGYVFMRHYRFLRLALLSALLTLSAGCQTTVGNYFGNRARDLGECFRLQGGVAVGLGVDIKVAGLAHLSLGLGADAPAIPGFVYGEFDGIHFFKHHAVNAFVGAGIWHYERADHRWGYTVFRHQCYAFLPGLFSWHGWRDPETKNGSQPLWLWSIETEVEAPKKYTAYIRWSRLHAFDIEAGVFVLLLGVRTGFSPGEF